MKDGIIRKIDEKTGIPVSWKRSLKRCPAFNSLLMEVYARKAKKITPPQLLQQ